MSAKTGENGNEGNTL